MFDAEMNEMPLYAFKCPACGRRFDELLPISKNSEAVCPACGASAERVWNGKCAFGAKKATLCDMNCENADCDECHSAAGGCSGNCANCAGCGV